MIPKIDKKWGIVIGLLALLILLITFIIWYRMRLEQTAAEETARLLTEQAALPKPTRETEPPELYLTELAEKLRATRTPAVGETAQPGIQPGVRTRTPVETLVDETRAPFGTQTPLTAAVARVFYVAPGGSDSNPGTLEKPWQTLRHASSRLKAGDTLYIRAGIYQETARWEADGRSDAPISILAYPGEQVIIDGNDMIPPNQGGHWLFEVNGDWYFVSGLEVTRAYDEGGIGVRGSNVTIDRCYSHHNWGAGITMMGDNGVAQNNLVWYNGVGNEFMSRSRGGWPAALTCARRPNNCTLRGNVSWENWGEGISTFEAYHTVIEDNISYDNQQNLYISDTQHTVVRRNFIYCTPGNRVGQYVTQNGILIGDERRNPPSSDNLVVNNIVYGCERNLVVGTNESNNSLIAFNTFVNSTVDANVYFYQGRCSNCYFMNNLVLQEFDLPIAHSGGVGWTISNNLWSRTPPRGLVGLNDIFDNPQMRMSGSPYHAEWFRLFPTSPAVDGAVVIQQITDDYFTIVRDENPDIGAIEY